MNDNNYKWHLLLSRNNKMAIFKTFHGRDRKLNTYSFYSLYSLIAVVINARPILSFYSRKKGKEWDLPYMSNTPNLTRFWLLAGRLEGYLRRIDSIWVYWTTFRLPRTISALTWLLCSPQRELRLRWHQDLFAKKKTIWGEQIFRLKKYL